MPQSIFSQELLQRNSQLEGRSILALHTKTLGRQRLIGSLARKVNECECT
jgi:hypothetical protein